MLKVTEALAGVAESVYEADAIAPSMQVLVDSVPDQCGRFCSVHTAGEAHPSDLTEASAQQCRWTPAPFITL